MQDQASLNAIKLVQCLGRKKPNKENIIYGSFSYFDLIDMLSIARVSKSLRGYANSIINNHKCWEEMYSHGFDEKRDMLWKLYWSMFLKESKVEKPYDDELAIEEYDDSSCVMYYEIERTSYATHNNKKKDENSDILKAVIKAFKPTDYWMMKHGLVYLVSLVSLSLKESKQWCMQMIQSMMGEPYLMEKLYRDDYYLVNLIVYQICQLAKLKLPDLYKHFKAISLQVSNMLIKWVICLFYDKESIYMSSEIVLRILDLFLVNGWKAIILACVSVLTLVKEKLILIKECEEIHKYFTTMEFKSIITTNALFEVYDSLQIYDDMLYDWEKMYIAKGESV